MKEIFEKCNPTICNRSDLLSADNTYMTKEVIKEQCKCINKFVCFEILRLLQDWHRPEANDMMDNIERKK